jgi:hypothetical protein
MSSIFWVVISFPFPSESTAVQFALVLETRSIALQMKRRTKTAYCISQVVHICGGRNLLGISFHNWAFVELHLSFRPSCHHPFLCFNF